MVVVDTGRETQALFAEGLSKCYSVAAGGAYGTLRDVIASAWRLGHGNARPREFWALTDLNLTVGRVGDVVDRSKS